jgi:hypothetical protein
MALSETWEILPEHYITSSERGLGRLELLQLIDEISESN